MFIMLEENKNETVKAHGKIVKTDFQKLDFSDIQPLYEHLTEEQLRAQDMLFSIDGKVYINSKSNFEIDPVEIFEILIKETRYSLDQNRKAFKKRFPQIKGFEDLLKLDNQEDMIRAIVCLSIPSEIKRREIERAYYARK